jgi:integrase
MAKYTKITKAGVEYYRTVFTLGGIKRDLIAKTEAELDTKIYEARRDYELGKTVNSPNVTVKTWAEEWLETYKKPYVVNHSYKTYRSIIENQIIPAIGPKKMKDVKPVHLQKIITSRIGFSASHISRVKTTLHAIFRQAVINNIRHDNPADALVMPNVEKKSRRAITDDEKAVLFKVCETHPQGLFPLLMYYCGLRPGETGALLWGDVDLKNNIIHINKATEAGSGNIKTTKTKAGIRDVPIPAEFAETLKIHAQGHKPSEYVLTTDGGKHAYAEAYRRWWRSIRRAMNIELGAKFERNKLVADLVAEDFTPYCLRHTFCTNLQRAGVPINVAKYLMGHSDINMTAGIYTHHTDDTTNSARSAVDAFYKSEAEKAAEKAEKEAAEAAQNDENNS